jgi:hypothetical protein
MASLAGFVPTLAQIEATYVGHKTAIVSLALILAASFASMITSAYCADHINKSQCGKSDPDAVKAHQWAMTSAVLGALVSTGAVVGCLYMLYKTMTKK